MVEACRTQVGGQAVEILLHAVGDAAEFNGPGGHLFGLVGILFEQAQPDLEARQGLARLVVKLARDRAPFRLLQVDLLAGQSLKQFTAAPGLVEQSGVVDGDRRRRRQTLRQFQVLLGEEIRLGLGEGVQAEHGPARHQGNADPAVLEIRAHTAAPHHVAVGVRDDPAAGAGQQIAEDRVVGGIEGHLSPVEKLDAILRARHRVNPQPCASLEQHDPRAVVGNELGQMLEQSPDHSVQVECCGHREARPAERLCGLSCTLFGAIKLGVLERDPDLVDNGREECAIGLGQGTGTAPPDVEDRLPAISHPQQRAHVGAQPGRRERRLRQAGALGHQLDARRCSITFQQWTTDRARRQR